NVPNVVQFAKDVQRFGAEGVTVHPRPDERHIRYQDVYDLKSEVYTEFNIEGNPVPKFIEMVLEIKPTQVTLVPDAENAITSNAGWDTLKHKDYLIDVIQVFKANGIRTSIFVDPVLNMVEGAKATGTDRIELYTEAFAHQYGLGNLKGIDPYVKTAELAAHLGLGINAGHDLSLDNIRFFKENIPGLLEVSIGHALISESLYLGIENVVQMYLGKLK
ncbi:MAG: pyridoxine 5'-phosphate synthase, partial [Mangrovimonas sp.]|nr:pyridoxine 5'-phosphate synthase [Mangrovimonas sp.]